jgi:hypothetical protein
VGPADSSWTVAQPSSSAAPGTQAVYAAPPRGQRRPIPAGR